MTDYIIAVCNTECDGIVMYRFRGELDELKNKLIEMVNEDKLNDEDSWDYGAETVDDVRVCGNYINAYATYHDYHIDYTALPLADFNWI